MFMESDFSGCFVRGIPVGVPVKCNFSAPDEKKSLFSDNTHIFVLMPVSKSEYNDDDDIFDLTENSESAQASETIDRKEQELASVSETEYSQEIESDEDQHAGEQSENSGANNIESEDTSTGVLSVENEHEASDSNKQVLKKFKRLGIKRKPCDEDWVFPNELNYRLDRNKGKVRRSSRKKVSKSVYDGADWYKFDQNIGDNEILLKYSKKNKNKPVNEGCKNETEVGEDSIVNAHPVDKIIIKTETGENSTNELKHEEKDKSDTETALNEEKESVESDVFSTSDSDLDSDNDIDTEDEEIIAAKEKVKRVKPVKSKQAKTNPGKKKKTRVIVKLEEHQDKYREEVVPSYARKDRGKSLEDCSVKLFVCEVCERFRTEDSLVIENHIEKHVNGELHCEECDFIGAYNAELQRHRRDVHQKNVFVCYKCGKGIFNGKIGLKDHLGRDHDQPQWECTFCKKETGTIKLFALRKLMREHIKKEHPDKMAKCKKCNRLFANKTFLRSHMNAGCYADRPPNSYPCEKCGKTFTTLHQVSDHISRIHSNIRKYKCPLCPFASPKKVGLTQHLHTHTGYHPVKCDLCTFSCVQKYQLTSHMRTHTGEKPYKCSQCKYAAAWKVQLKDHIKVHSLAVTVNCEQCSIEFKDSRALQNHQRKDHKSEIGSDSKKKSSPKEKQ